MGIETIFAHVGCSNIQNSTPLVSKLFGKAPIRRPMPGLVEWQFTESAEAQLYEQRDNAGHSDLTLGVLPTGTGAETPGGSGAAPGPIEEAKSFFIMRMRNPDGNLIVFASAEKD
jgi:hypothetical protein